MINSNNLISNFFYNNNLINIISANEGDLILKIAKTRRVFEIGRAVITKNGFENGVDKFFIPIKYNT